MVKHLIFNTKILNDTEKGIINTYINCSLNSDNSKYLYTYEYYIYHNNNIDYEEMDSSIEELLENYPELVDNYILILSLDDFYRAINKEIIFELW